MSAVPPLHQAEASRLLAAACRGPDLPVHRVSDPTAPEAASVVVVPNVPEGAWAAWRGAGVAAVVLPATAAGPELDDGATSDAGPAIWAVADVRLALARLTRRLDPRPPIAAVGVHPLAAVDPSAHLGADVAIGAGAVIGAGARLGDRVVVGPGAVVAAGVEIGADTVLAERVVVADGVRVGARCRVQAGAVLGSDGFGYAAGPQGAERIHHLGTVVIGDDVEIGANACVDRATLGATVVGDRTKVDNMVQIAHNVRIGRDVLIAGQTGIAGSTTIGDGVILGGAVGVADHVTIGAGARIAGGAGVTKDVPAGESWGGYPAQPVKRWARERYLIGRLEAIWAAVRGRG